MENIRIVCSSWSNRTPKVSWTSEKYPKIWFRLPMERKKVENTPWTSEKYPKIWFRLPMERKKVENTRIVCSSRSNRTPKVPWTSEKYPKISFRLSMERKKKGKYLNALRFVMRFNEVGKATWNRMDLVLLCSISLLMYSATFRRGVNKKKQKWRRVETRSGVYF